MGKSAFSAPQSEMSSVVLTVKIQQKISQEMYSIKLSSPVFIGDSEIVLRIIAKNNPADLPIFYGTRVMEIAALTTQINGSGILALSTLPTYSTDLVQLWNRSILTSCSMGVFFSKPKHSWPIKKCASFLSSSPPIIMVKRFITEPVNPFTNLITDLLHQIPQPLQGVFSPVPPPQGLQ